MDRLSWINIVVIMLTLYTFAPIECRPITKFTPIQNNIGDSINPMLGSLAAKQFKMDDGPAPMTTETTEPSKAKDKEQQLTKDDDQESVEVTTTSELEYDLDEELKEISPWLPALLKYFNVIS